MSSCCTDDLLTVTSSFVDCYIYDLYLKLKLPYCLLGSPCGEDRWCIAQECVSMQVNNTNSPSCTIDAEIGRAHV